MLPNRRLRDEMARADRLERQRKSNDFGDDQKTVVPVEDRVPDELRLGREEEGHAGVRCGRRSRKPPHFPSKKAAAPLALSGPARRTINAGPAEPVA